MSVTVTLADGSARASSRTWGDGVSDCPWCEYPMFGGSCGNPACDVQLDAGQLAARRAVQEQRAAAEAADRRLTAWVAESRARADAERDALWAELSGKAEEAGQCITCLRKSYWQSGHGKFIRHRDPGNCPNTRR